MCGAYCYRDMKDGLLEGKVDTNDPFETWVWRRIQKTKWMHRVSDEVTMLEVIQTRLCFSKSLQYTTLPYCIWCTM